MQLDEVMKYMDYKEPLLAEWALGKYKSLRVTSPDQALQFDKALFSDEFIKAAMEAMNLNLHTSLFFDLPAERFSRVIDSLSNRWLDGYFAPIFDKNIFQIIAKNNPQKARAIMRGEKGKFSLAERIYYVAGLDSLSPEDGKAFSEEIINDYVNNRDDIDDDERYRTGLSVATLAVTYAHPDAASLVRDFLTLALGEEEPEPVSFSENFITLFGGDYFEFNIFYNLYYGDLERVPECLNRFYRIENGAEMFRNLTLDIMGSKIEDFKAFVLSHLDAVKDETVKEVLRMLVTEDAVATALMENRLEGFFQGAVLAILWYHYRGVSMDVHPITEEDALELLGLEVGENPFIEELKAYFAGIDEKKAETLLLDLLEKTGCGFAGSHVLTVMDSLKNPGFAPALVDAMMEVSEYSEDYEVGVDDFRENCPRVLSRLGNRVIELLDERFHECPPLSYLFMFDLIQNIATPEAESFLIKHLDAFMEEFRSDTLEACSLLLSREALRHFEHKVGKEQFWIDKAFVTLSLLTGKRDEQVEALLKLCNRYNERAAKKLAPLFDEDQEVAETPFLTLEMSCEKCGDVNEYKVFRVYPAREGSPYVADELTCINCNETGELKVTQNGEYVISAEVLRLLELLEQEGAAKEDLLEESPIKFLRTVIMGREMEVADGIELYKEKIAKRPRDPENHIGLGNIYKFFKQFTSAEKRYLKAIELSPFYIEPYLSLAEMAVEKGNETDALNWLEKGRKYLKRPVVCKGMERIPQKTVEQYIDLYNSLVEKTKSELDLITDWGAVDAVVLPQKIGRNDPCPCGSGKKYKKCCMNR